MRKSVWIVIGLGIAAAVYSGVWYATATFVRQQTEQWLEARRQQGFVVTTAAPILSGFPLKAETSFTDFSLGVPGSAAAPGWTWHAPALRIYARPFVLDRFFMDLTGTYRFSGFEEHDTPVSIAHGLATFVLGAGGVDHVAMDLAHVESPHGALDKADADIAVKDTGLHIDMTTAHVTLPDALPPPLSRTLENLKFSADITGSIATGAPLPDALETWRTAGGTVEVRDFAFDWPPVSGTGSGTLALDKALQPEGAFSGTFKGFLQVVDMLVTAGRMKPGEASLARGALMLLSTTPHEGAPPELKVSVTVQGRKAYAGPVTLMEIPPITWRKDLIVP